MLSVISSVSATMGDGMVARPLEVQLAAELKHARALEEQVRHAVDALQRSECSDVEGVLRATGKAEAAFQMVQAARNAMLHAYAHVHAMGV